MGFAYKLHELAEDEYIEAYLWYEEQREGLGDRFAIAVRNRIEDIANNPEFYSIKKGVFREVNVDNTFPFLIVYVIEKEKNLVIINAIYHTSRNPKKKYRK